MTHEHEADQHLSISQALGRLLKRMPHPGATDAELVAWFHDKADVLHQIAEAGGPEAVEAAELAAKARARAEQYAAKGGIPYPDSKEAGP